MNKRAFFLGALGLAIAGFITHCVARGFLEKAMHREAANISQAVKEQAPYAKDPVAVQESHMWNVLTGAAVVLTVLSAVCVATAAIRREPGWYSIPLLLLVLDIGVFMLL